MDSCSNNLEMSRQVVTYRKPTVGTFSSRQNAFWPHLWATGGWESVCFFVSVAFQQLTIKSRLTEDFSQFFFCTFGAFLFTHVGCKDFSANSRKIDSQHWGRAREEVLEQGKVFMPSSYSCCYRLITDFETAISVISFPSVLFSRTERIRALLWNSL